MTISQTAQSSPASFYFGGCDLGKKRDHSVIAVVQKRGQEVYLVYVKRFALGTEYGSVIGWLNLLNQRLKEVRRILIDQTGVGEVFVEEAVKSGLKNARGIMLSLPKKQEIMVYLRQLMEDGRLHLPFDRELINEMNVERYELKKTGQSEFSHPDGTHDDRLWALALAVYASRPEIPEYHPVVITGKLAKPGWEAAKAKEYAKPGDPGTVTSQNRCLTCWTPKGPDGKCPKGHPG